MENLFISIALDGGKYLNYFIVGNSFSMSWQCFVRIKSQMKSTQLFQVFAFRSDFLNFSSFFY